MGIEGPFLNEYVDEIVKLMGDVYPEIVDNRELIRRVILSEEERFGATLRQGQVYLAEALDEARGRYAFRRAGVYFARYLRLPCRGYRGNVRRSWRES